MSPSRGLQLWGRPLPQDMESQCGDRALGPLHLAVLAPTLHPRTLWSSGLRRMEEMFLWLLRLQGQGPAQAFPRKRMERPFHCSEKDISRVP